MGIHFHSSTEYGGIVAGLIRSLSEHGLEAKQHFQISLRRYRRARGAWRRLLLRIEQYLLYPVILAWSLIRKRTDIAVVCTNTFYAPLVATLVHRRVIYLMYDVFPEALVYAGKLQSGSWKERWIHWITQKGLDRCVGTVFLGERLKVYVGSRYDLKNPAWVIPVGADTSLFQANLLSRENQLHEGSLTAAQSSRRGILYCGNFGYMHDVDTVIRVWQREVALAFRWVFRCVGPRVGKVARAMEEVRDLGVAVDIGAGLDEVAWVAALKEFPIGLVTMLPGSEQVVMPSKTYSAMCAGQAILAIAPEDSDLVDLIKAEDCGWWVEPGDVDGIERVLKGILSDPTQLERKRSNARKAGQEKYSTQVLAVKWAALLRKLS